MYCKTGGAENAVRLSRRALQPNAFLESDVEVQASPNEL